MARSEKNYGKNFDRRHSAQKMLSMGRLSSSLAWLLPFALLVLAIVAVPLLVLDDQGLPRYRALKQELAEVENENERLKREVRDIAREVEALKSDPEAIEQIARDELGMVREGELIFQFPN